MKPIKKFLSLVLAVAMLSMTAGQVLADGLKLSDTTKIAGATGDNYAVPTSDEYHIGSNYYMHLVTPDGGLELHQTYTETLPAGDYTFEFKGKGTGKFIFYSNWSGEYFGISATEGTDLGNGWKQYQKPVAMDGNGDSKFLLVTDGAVDFCIDDIKMVDSSGKNYLPDGGFTNVSNNGGTLSHSYSQIEGKGDSGNRTATVEEEATGNTYSLHVYTTGSQIDLSQDFTETLTTGTYTLTAYMKGTGALWYYHRNAEGGWSSEWAKFDMEYGTPGTDGWCKFEKELTVAADGMTNFLFYTEGAADLYIDDISLVDSNDVNYVPDGGFDEVTVIEPTPTPTPTPTPEVEKPALEAFTGTLTLSSTTKVEGTQTETRYAKVTCEEFHGNSGYSLHLYATAPGLEFGQKYTVSQLPAGEYTVTWYAKGEDGNMAFWSDWGENARTNVVTPEIQEDGWKKYSTVLNIDGNGDTRFLFYTDTAVDCYIDDISLIDAAGNNYIIDGTFDEVTIDGFEQYKLSSVTTVEGTQNENRYAKVVADDKNSGNYSLHVYSTSAGFEFGQKYTVSQLPAGNYTVTWYAKGNDGNMAFWSDWGESARNVSIGYETQANGWKKYTSTLAIDGSGDTRFLFYIDTAVDFYIDDISLVDANGVNYIKDGGFECSINNSRVQKLRSFQAGDGAVTVKWNNPEYDGIRGIRLYADGRFLSGDFDLSSSVANSFTLTGLEEGKRVKVMVELYIAGEIMPTYIDIISNNVAASTEFAFGDWIANKSIESGSNAVNFTPDHYEMASGESSMRIDIEKDWTEGFAPYIKQVINGVSDSSTYQLKFKSKAENVTVFYVIEESNWAQTFVIREGHDGVSDLTYDWKETTLTFTPAAGETQTEIYFYVESGHGSVWIDDVSLTEVGSTANLVKNGGFEYVDYIIEAPTFVDANGNVLTQIQSGLVEVRAKITNYTMGDSFCPVVIAALYNGNELLAMTYAQLQVVESIKDMGNEFCLAINVPEVYGLYKIKVMQWDGFETIKPLGDTGILE